MSREVKPVETPEGGHVLETPGTPVNTTPNARQPGVASSVVATPANLSATPTGSFRIPATPTMQRLGYGTGVNVMLYARSPRLGLPRSPWALKKLRRRDNGGVTDFVALRLEEEARILCQLDHPNIIGFRGFVKNPDGSRALAMEHGQVSLMDYIEEVRQEASAVCSEGEPYGPLEPYQMMRVMKGVASALDYLHNRHKLLHGDIKSANILVMDDFFVVKLCDFGVTVPLDDLLVAKKYTGDAMSAQYIGTELWSAKEVVLGEEVSDKTDIFALGCCIYEMLTFEVPHYDMLPELDESTNSVDDERYNEAIGTRPRLPNHLATYKNLKSFKSIFFLFEAMTEEDVTERPTAVEVLSILEEAEELQLESTTDSWSSSEQQ